MDLHADEERPVLADDLRNHPISDSSAPKPQCEFHYLNDRDRDAILAEHDNHLRVPLQAGNRVPDVFPILQMGQDVLVCLNFLTSFKD